MHHEGTVIGGRGRRDRWRRAAAGLAALAVLALAACGKHEDPTNLLPRGEKEERVVNLFRPMEKMDPDAENVARTASDLTVMMAEEQLGVPMV